MAMMRMRRKSQPLYIPAPNILHDALHFALIVTMLVLCLAHWWLPVYVLIVVRTAPWPRYVTILLSNAVLTFYSSTISYLYWRKRNEQQQKTRKQNALSPYVPLPSWVHGVTMYVIAIGLWMVSYAYGKNNDVHFGVAAAAAGLCGLGLSWRWVLPLSLWHLVYILLQSYDDAFHSGTFFLFADFYSQTPSFNFLFYWYVSSVALSMTSIGIFIISEILRHTRNELVHTFDLLHVVQELLAEKRLMMIQKFLQTSTQNNTYCSHNCESFRANFYDAFEMLNKYRSFFPQHMLAAEDQPIEKKNELRKLLFIQTGFRPAMLTKMLSGGTPDTPGSDFSENSTRTTTLSSSMSSVQPTVGSQMQQVVVATLQCEVAPMGSVDSTMPTCRFGFFGEACEREQEELILHILSRVSSAGAAVQSYRDGAFVFVWKQSLHDPRPHLRAVTTCCELVHEIKQRHSSNTVSMAWCGIDVSLCQVGVVGSPELLMFSELRGPAVEISRALCGLCEEISATVLITPSMHHQIEFDIGCRKVASVQMNTLEHYTWLPRNYRRGGTLGGSPIFEAMLHPSAVESIKEFETALEKWIKFTHKLLKKNNSPGFPPVVELHASPSGNSGTFSPVDSSSVSTVQSDEDLLASATDPLIELEELFRSVLAKYPDDEVTAWYLQN
eukprot:PhF_6_TR44148/c0_g1_i3/m.67522